MSVRGIDARQHEDARRRSQACVDEAVASAAAVAAVSLVLSAAFVGGLSRWSKAFRSKFNTSVKAAFTVMPPFYAFYLESERAVYRCHSNADGNEHMNVAKLRAMRARSAAAARDGGGAGRNAATPQG